MSRRFRVGQILNYPGDMEEALRTPGLMFAWNEHGIPNRNVFTVCQGGRAGREGEGARWAYYTFNPAKTWGHKAVVVKVPPGMSGPSKERLAAACAVLCKELGL